MRRCSSNLLFGGQIHDIMEAVPEGEHTFQVDSPAQSIAGVTLKPWDQRKRNATTIQRALQSQLERIAGQRVVAFQPPPLPGAQGLPIQFVLKSTRPLDQLIPCRRNSSPRHSPAACSCSSTAT